MKQPKGQFKVLFIIESSIYDILLLTMVVNSIIECYKTLLLL